MRIPGLSLLSKSRLRHRLGEERGLLVRLAYAWCHDPALAEDLTQETMARALSRAGQLRDPERLRSWLCSILANALRDHYRRRRPDLDIDSLDAAELALHETPEDLQASAELTARVRAAVARLPLGQRQALTLVDLEGFSYAQTAQILGIPAGTVMSRLSRGREALRRPLLDLRTEPAQKLRVIK